MKRLGEVFGSRGKLLLCAAGLLTAGMAVFWGLAGPTPGRAQNQTQAVAQGQSPAQAQSTTAAAPGYEYEVVSIRPNKSPGFPNVTVGEDGLTVLNIQLMRLLYSAFGMGPDQIVGAPDWLDSEKYDINAKIDHDTAEALKKLSPDDRKAARQHMMQMIFVDRCKLKYHLETKNLQVYNLVIGKTGIKFQESKAVGASAPSPNAANNVRVGRGGVVEFHALPMSALVQILSQQLGATVVDKTGLTGMYDFTWQYGPDGVQGRGAGESQPPAGGAGPVASLDSGGASVFTQVQELLGLKLESSKGPVPIIVIDHIEKPSDN